MQNIEVAQDQAIKVLQQVSNKNRNQIFLEYCQAYPKYNLFIPNYYQQDEFGTKKALFKLDGNFQIKHSNQNTYYVKAEIRFPEQYPEVPLNIKLINPNPQQFMPSRQYAPNKTQDHNIQLNAGVGQKQLNLIQILDNISATLTKEFPFYSIQPQHQLQPYPQPQPQPQPQPYNPIQQQPAQQIKPSPQQSKQEQQNQASQLMLILLTDIHDHIQKSNIDINVIKKKKLELDKYEQELEYGKEQISVKMKMVENSISNFNNFLNENNSNQPTEETAEQLIQSVDPLSEQIIDLSAQNQALKDLYRFLNQKFKKDPVEIEWVLNQTRRYAELEFQNQQLLKKCLKVCSQ